MGVNLVDNLKLQLYGSSYTTSIYNICNYIEEYIKSSKNDNISINTAELLNLTWLSSDGTVSRDKISVLNKMYIDKIINYLSENGLIAKYDGGSLLVYGWHLKHNLSSEFGYLYTRWRSKAKKDRNKIKVISTYLEDYIIDGIKKKFRAFDVVEFPLNDINNWIKETEKTTNLRLKDDGTYDKIISRVINDLIAYGFDARLNQNGRMFVSGWK